MVPTTFVSAHLISTLRFILRPLDLHRPGSFERSLGQIDRWIGEAKGKRTRRRRGGGDGKELMAMAKRTNEFAS